MNPNAENKKSSSLFQAMVCRLANNPAVPGLALLWVLINVIIFYRFGIVTGYEAEKYIGNAESILQNGRMSSPQFLFYSVQSLLIAFAKQTGSFPYLPVAIQLLVNAISMACFYKTVMLANNNKKVAAFATAVLISMFYYQLYNAHLFTESLYFSLSIIYTYTLLKIAKLNLNSLLLPLLLLIVLYFTRPVGLFFIPATFLFITLKFFPKKIKLLFSLAAFLFLFAFLLLLNFSLNIGGSFDFLLPYAEAHIICGAPTVATPYVIEMPVEKNSVQGLLYILVNHWQLCITLWFKRAIAFWGVTRTYYTTAHNLFVAAYFYSIYASFLSGIKKWQKADAPVLSFIICLIFLTAFTAMLSCDEWHNRFILAVFPFLLLGATYAFKPSINKHPTHQNKTQ